MIGQIVVILSERIRSKAVTNKCIAVFVLPASQLNLICTVSP